MMKLLAKAPFPILYLLVQLLVFSFIAHFSFAQSLPAAATNSNVISPAIMTATFSCPNGQSAQNTVTYSSGSTTTLSSDVCAYNVIVNNNAVLETNGYTIYALESFTNNGIVENRNGGAGGGSYSDAGGNGDGGTGPDTSGLTGSLSGGSGGSSNYQSGLCILPGDCAGWGSGGAGGGGANANGGQRQSDPSGGSSGGDYGGGGGGGGAFGGGGNNGANGGGYIEIYANRFINNGLISVAGHNASGSAAWAGGGGGGGYVYILITTENPTYAVLGSIDANGGNAATVASSTYCGGGGGGGGGVVKIKTEPGILSPNSYTSAYGSVSVVGGSASSDSAGCENGSPGGNGIIDITNAPPVPPPAGCSGPADSYHEKYGYCVFVNSASISTPYPDAIGGTLEPVQSYTSSSPTTANELSYEQQNAQWLITCPLVPNALATANYFSTATPQFISGDRCLASTAPLSTKIVVNTTVSWAYNSIANSTTNINIENPGRLSVSNLGYAGETQLMNSSYAVSNLYNTESYIFDSLPTSNESGVWTWTFEFVNFSKLSSGQIASLSQKQREFPKPGSTFPYLQYYNTSTDCLYNYTYTESVDFKSIGNEQIPVPVNLPSLLPYRIKFANGTVSGTSTAKRADTNCAQWLFWDGNPNAFPSLCNSNLGINLVSRSAAFYYANAIQPGGSGCNLYIVSGGNCIGSKSFVYTANDVVNGVNIYANDYIVATASWEPPSIFNGCLYLRGCLYDYKAYVIPASELHFENVRAIPYLLYNFSTPATVSDVNGRTRYLNESYDMYSPHNYLNPNSLEPYGLHTGSAVFATIMNSSGSYFVEFPYSAASETSNTAFSNPNPNFVSALNSSQQAAETNSNNPLTGLLSLPVGLFKSGKILTPSYAISTPNDYLYLINHTTSIHNLVFADVESYIYTIRMIPFGYYNLTNIQPNFAVNSISPNSIYPNNAVWESAWESYWKDALAEQGQNYYITNLTRISRSNSYACLSWTFSCLNGKKAVFADFIPTYVTSDYADDIFLAGLDAAYNPPRLELAAYFTNYTPSNPAASQVTSVVSPSSDAGFTLAQDLAASAGGQFLYLSNRSYPNIPMFSSNTLTYLRNISLSYSNFTYNLNITSYLAHGGPFNSTAVAKAYANVGNVVDVSTNHHPVSIFDYGNLLYVVDNWTFTVNGLMSSMLMLRVFYPNGTAIPLDGVNYNDLIINASQAGVVDTSGTNITTTITNPPYGWPLSVNISIGNNKYVSYCVADCEYSPSSAPSTDKNYNGYPPIGPFMIQDGFIGPNLNDTAFYMDYNGTAYMITHTEIPSTHSTNGRFQRTSETTYKGLYTEFLRFKPEIINYTKIALSSYVPYDCLINITASGPCTQNSYISDMYPPFTVTPSPSRFVFGEGSASDYYDAQAVSQSLFPGGFGSYNGIYSSNTQNAISTSSNSPGLGSSYVSNGITANVVSANNENFIRITSTIGGYALIPYNISYTVTKDWNLISTDPNNNNACPNVLPKSNTFVYNGISVLQVNASPAQANVLVEGGPTYLKYFNTNNFYDANLSDNSSIIPPSTAYNIFTNRLFGSIIINQSINSSGAGAAKLIQSQKCFGNFCVPTSSYGPAAPKIINYTRLYNYSLYNVMQAVPNGNNYYGYSYEKVVLANISTTPPSNIPVYGVSNSLLSNPNVFAGNNLITYSNRSTPSVTNIFQQFTYFNYYNLLALSFPNDRQILGYNRLVYIMQDAFNNTIYVPVDVDIANTTMVTVNVNPIVSVTNANQTRLNITGNAGYISGTYAKSFAPLPEGSKIYLYYDTPLNYYNSTVSPLVSSEATQYYTYAEKCAFGDNPGVVCNFANPLSEYTQGLVGSTEANVITYNSQFNSSGVCPPPPRHSLLNITVPIDCSINNDTAYIPANTALNGISSAPYPRYCEPEFLNGSGVLTSQLGLAAILTTNSTGGFSTNAITACGTGTSQVIAKYYGGPYPEPNIYSQPPISNSISLLSPTQSAVSTYEYNYSFAPNQTSGSFSIGSYYLSVGNISIIVTIFAIAMLIIYQLRPKRAIPKGINKANKGKKPFR